MAVDKEFFDNLEDSLEERRGEGSIHETDNYTLEPGERTEIRQIIEEQEIPYEQNFETLSDAIDYAQKRLDRLDKEDLDMIYNGSREKYVRDVLVNSPNVIGGTGSPNSPTGAL